MRLSATESALRRALRGPCALPTGSTVLAAVSGGADSTAMLIALARLAPSLGLRIVVAHLDHAVRGEASAADAVAVRALASRLRLRCISAKLRSGGEASETALRAKRLRFLSRAAARASAAAISTAHTADDQLETLLMRLERGAGLTGLSGMRARRGRWIKPLLALSRLAIEQDLRRAGVPWREDAGNQDLSHTRSRVRHQAIPSLVAAVAPGRPADRARARLAQRTAAALAELAEADLWIDRLADECLARALEGDALRLREWRQAPSLLSRRVLRRWWHRAIGRQHPSLTSRHLDTLEQIATSGRGGARAALPAGWWAEVASGRLELHQGGGPRSARPSARREEPSLR